MLEWILTAAVLLYIARRNPWQIVVPWLAAGVVLIVALGLLRIGDAIAIPCIIVTSVVVWRRCARTYYRGGTS